MVAKGRKPKFLVDVRWLREHHGDPAVVLVDTRPKDDYWAGHLRGARHFDPLPFRCYDTSEHGIAEFTAELEWIFSALGIGGSETVVFYEENSGIRAAGAAWALEYLGHPRVRILDGGLALARSEKLVTAAPRYASARLKTRLHQNAAATSSYLLECIERPGVRVLDVRHEREYYGEEQRARRSGAIPGAVHQEWVEALSPSGAFKPAAELRRQYQELGLDPADEIIPYCQTGYRAAHACYALRLAGYQRVRNYFGSWAEWGNREELPIEYPRRRGLE